MTCLSLDPLPLINITPRFQSISVGARFWISPSLNPQPHKILSALRAENYLRDIPKQDAADKFGCILWSGQARLPAIRRMFCDLREAYVFIKPFSIYIWIIYAGRVDNKISLSNPPAKQVG
jgi:hypothetical protein